MKTNQFSELLALLRRFLELRIPHTIRLSRDNAIMIVAHAPGEYWEIEFLEGEEMEIERFKSDGAILDEPELKELYAMWSDEEPVTENNAKPHEAAARN